MSKGTQKYIYYFGKKGTDGSKDMKELLGGKGANLAEMTSIGLPVPPGFTITTKVCAEYYARGKRLPRGLMDSVKANIKHIEKETGKKFGSSETPLLVSVRSGAAVSMPGMMDTVLNLGLTDQSLDALANQSGDYRFALDAYRRLIHMFGDVVQGVAHQKFESAFEKIKSRYGAVQDTDMGIKGLEELVKTYKKIYRTTTKKDFPQDPYVQLELAIEAVFRSWNIPRARRYREINDIKGLLGTAVNVQTMVFGNMGEDSGTGVAFTRNPSTGQNKFYGEFLVNAQGEDVVAGIRTPRHVDEMKKWRNDVYIELQGTKRILEKHYRDMQDIEFTIEKGHLYLLQTRTGKRTGKAAVKIAVDMVKERKINQKTALLRVPALDLNQLLLPTFDPSAPRTVLSHGLPASPGAASGKLAFTAEDAVRKSENGERVLLVRRETSPEDIDGMHVADGILTSTGGTTSHAAVVARGWGKCCVAGAVNTVIDEHTKTVIINGRQFTEADILSIDGTTGEVMLGEIPKVEPKLLREFNVLMQWADRYRKLGIRANADTPHDARKARSFGAEGIGLCRTEHMFFEGNRIHIMREMILAKDTGERKQALKKLLPFQRKDFTGIFKVMNGLPVTIRLLDPPLHEFLPQDEPAQEALAKSLKIKLSEIKERVWGLAEQNPMLGHRGCRLLITYPEILEMQVKAITEAAIQCLNKGVKVQAEIMIPLIGIEKELEILHKQVSETISTVCKAKGYKRKLNIAIGTMIEIPRAALTADEIANHADFFSFGTNDLTQMTLGYSRDDINSFLPDYIHNHILERSPFQYLDTTGVGQLVTMAVKKGRSVKKSLKCGLCGEHGGEPSSIRFLHNAGLDYVSCSPFRVPVARLAAAQAALA